MKLLKKVLFAFLLFAILIPITSAREVANIYLFYGKECPHCEALIEKLEYIKDDYPFKVYMYETWHNSKNAALAKEVAEKLDTQINGVPFMVINNTAMSGYSSSSTLNMIKYNVNESINSNNEDIVLSIDGITDSEVYEYTIIEGKHKTKENSEDIEIEDGVFVTIPLINKEINLKSFALPVIAIIMGAVDGFNPCAMWILLFLISMLITMKDSKKRWILGLTFLVTSALVYLLFMVSLLKFTEFIAGVVWFKIVIALVAIFGGTINLINFINSLNKDDGCNIVDEKKRKKYITKIKEIVNNKSFILALIGIMLLAASVNIVELACSAGLPITFTTLLVENNLTGISYMAYILLYIFFFLIDDIIVFVISMKTLEVTGISTKYAKFSHLVGGIIMFLIGISLIYSVIPQ